MDQTVYWEGTFIGKLIQSGIYINKLKATLKNCEVIEKKLKRKIKSFRPKSNQ